MNAEPASVTANRFDTVVTNQNTVTHSSLRQELKRRGHYSKPAENLPIAPDNRELRAALAKKYGRFCGQCGAEIARHCSVWSHFTPWRSPWKTTVCMAFGPDISPDVDTGRSSYPYRSGVCTCGRRVFRDGLRSKHTFCCDQHEWESRNRVRQHADPKKRHCEGCGISFTPEKDTARFHSNACRQKAYRQRQQGVVQ